MSIAVPLELGCLSNMLRVLTFSSPPFFKLIGSFTQRCGISRSLVTMAPRIINAVTADHRQIEDCYSKVLSSPHNDEKTWWQNLFTWELARHSIDEELVICPRFEKKVPEGRAMAEEHRREHQSACL